MKICILEYYALSPANINETSVLICIMIDAMMEGTSEQTQIGIYIVLRYNDGVYTNKYMYMYG